MSECSPAELTQWFGPLLPVRREMAGTSETGRLLPISGASFSWFSRETAPCIPSLLGTLVLFLELYPLLPSVLRDQGWVWKSTFQSVAAWNGYGGFPPIVPATLYSLCKTGGRCQVLGLPPAFL